MSLTQKGQLLMSEISKLLDTSAMKTVGPAPPHAGPCAPARKITRNGLPKGNLLKVKSSLADLQGCFVSDSNRPCVESSLFCNHYALQIWLLSLGVTGGIGWQLGIDL